MIKKNCWIFSCWLETWYFQILVAVGRWADISHSEEGRGAAAAAASVPVVTGGGPGRTSRPPGLSSNILSPANITLRPTSPPQTPVQGEVWDGRELVQPSAGGLLAVWLSGREESQWASVWGLVRPLLCSSRGSIVRRHTEHWTISSTWSDHSHPHHSMDFSKRKSY